MKKIIKQIDIELEKNLEDKNSKLESRRYIGLGREQGLVMAKHLVKIKLRKQERENRNDKN